MDFSQDLKKRFAGAADFTQRSLRAAGVDCRLCFLDGLCSGAEIAEFVIRPLGRLSEPLAPPPLLAWALAGGTYAASVSRCADADDAEAKPTLPPFRNWDGNKAKCGNKTRKIPAFFQKTIAFLLIRCYNCPVIG